MSLLKFTMISLELIMNKVSSDQELDQISKSGNGAKVMDLAIKVREALEWAFNGHFTSPNYWWRFPLNSDSEKAEVLNKKSIVESNKLTSNPDQLEATSSVSGIR